METRCARVKQDVDDSTGIPEDCLIFLRGQIITVRRPEGNRYWRGGNEKSGDWEWLEDQLEFYPDGKVVDNLPD